MNQIPSQLEEFWLAKVYAKLIDENDPLVVWDAEFLTVEESVNWPGVEDQVVEAVPFAVNCAGDYWAYVFSEKTKALIALCYHDSTDAKYYANSLSDFLFRRTVEFAGNEVLDGSPNSWSLELAQGAITLCCDAFDKLLNRKQLEVLRRISVSNGVTEEGWTTLIPLEESERIVSENVSLSIENPNFVWRADS